MTLTGTGSAGSRGSVCVRSVEGSWMAVTGSGS
jgi:hypothetical protein